MISFAKDVRPLFRDADIRCMKARGVFLDDFAYIGAAPGDRSYADHAVARHVYAHLTGEHIPRMPLGGPYWNAQMLEKYLQWMDGGFNP